MQIAEVAVRLFLERGYEKTTVEETVRRVEISQPTFHGALDPIGELEAALGKLAPCPSIDRVRYFWYRGNFVEFFGASS